MNDDEEQPGTRARISNLIAGLHDDEICTHLSQMVIEAIRKEMEIFERMKVYRVVTRESMERDEEVKMISIKWVVTNKGTEEHPIAKARLLAREFNTGDKRGELFAGTPGLMAMRTVISRGMARKDQSCWLMSRQLFCMATQRGRCTLSCHRRILCQLLVDTWENLNVPCMELETLR